MYVWKISTACKYYKFVPKKRGEPKKANEKFKVSEILFVLSAVGVVVFFSFVSN
jgi:hypothetical protein